MKNSDAIAIFQKKDLVKGLEGKYKFTKALVNNFELIKKELSFISEYVNPSKEFIEFLGEKEAILKKYSDKSTVDGDLVNYNIPEDKQDEYKQVMTELLGRYKDTIDATKEQEQKYLEVLKDECTIPFMLIAEADIPDKITMEQMEVIFHWIKM